MFIFHFFHFSQSLSCTAQIHLAYLFMFPPIPLFPLSLSFTLSLWVPLSLRLQFTLIQFRIEQLIHYEIRSFSALQLYGPLTLQLSFFPLCNTLCHQHPIAHGLTYHHVDSGPVDLFLMASACSSVNLTVRGRLFVYCTLSRCCYVCHINEWGLVKPTSCFYRSIKAWMINECIFSP